MDDPSIMTGLQRYPLARRGLMAGGLAGGVTLAAQQAEAQAIHTDAAGLDAGEARIPVHNGHLPAYFARPAHGTHFPVVLVFEEVFGINPYIQDVCRRFARLGCMAVATDYYARLADLAKVSDREQIMHVVRGTPDAQYMGDADASIAWAGRNKGNAAQAAVNGFCAGGRQAWLYAAHNPRLKAAVSWYGPLRGNTAANQPHTALDLVDQVKCPVLGLYGGQDALNPEADIAAARAKAKAAHHPVEIVVYPDAPHGFHADYRPSYRAADAEDGWKRAVAWFRRYGVMPKG